MRSRPILAALLLLGTSSCISEARRSGVVLATDPPGARILVDGADSGRVTPCHIDLPRDRTRVDLELPGYETATRWVMGDSETTIVPWRDMAISPSIWRNPLWLEWTAFLFPIHRDVYVAPTRIFVRMRTGLDE